MRHLVTLAALLALVALPATARATQFNFNVSIDGTQAGTGSPGTGSATLVLDDVANTIAVDLSFSGLLSATTDAHIHCCSPPGMNSPVIIPFNPPFPLGVTSGTLNHTFNITAAQVLQVESGGAYINIHTGTFPAGEIRGQIEAIPEPGTLFLLGSGLAALGALRSRLNAG
jgi:hypothetical protein